MSMIATHSQETTRQNTGIPMQAYVSPARAAMHAKVDALVDAFLAKGGQITVCRDDGTTYAKASPKASTVQHYYAECIHMLERQSCDWHVGAAERHLIAECYATGRPITSAVAYVMRAF